MRSKNKILLYTQYEGYEQKHRQQVLARIQRNRSPHMPLVGMENGALPVGKSLVIAQ